MRVNVYLHFDGRCEEAFQYYEKHLGGKIEMLMRHKGSPAEPHCPPEWLDKVLHVRLKLGDDVIMASDAPPGHFENQQGFSVSLSIKDPAAGERAFKALADGGTVIMPFEQTFFANRFGMAVDRFGIPWMVNCE